MKATHNIVYKTFGNQWIMHKKQTEPNAIMHHAIGMYGTDCENCGKPYRTPKAKICAACGNKSTVTD